MVKVEQAEERKIRGIENTFLKKKLQMLKKYEPLLVFYFLYPLVIKKIF